MTGDLDQDGIDDLAILYTLEGIGGGGNNYSSFLAVFLRTEEGLKFSSDILVGGKSSRSLSFKSIENGVITFDTRFSTIREDGTWDPSCCPSGEGEAFYVLFYGELRELNVAEAAPIDWKKVRKVMKAN
ncbi:hypothetical protein [Desulfosediminicola ganghwensis]|uniref:hypothetical protein n=1 Tax=Desulfosediminicola ganghwensis TaxID=2569540 RepID=UPI0010AC234E|nr:hypothetical protein [Desulfosediminicola ganghwensis]